MTARIMITIELIRNTMRPRHLILTIVLQQPDKSISYLIKTHKVIIRYSYLAKFEIYFFAVLK